jgi:hypothetical protein
MSTFWSIRGPGRITSRAAIFSSELMAVGLECIEMFECLGFHCLRASKLVCLNITT